MEGVLPRFEVIGTDVSLSSFSLKTQTAGGIRIAIQVGKVPFPSSTLREPLHLHVNIRVLSFFLSFFFLRQGLAIAKVSLKLAM